MEGTDMSLTIEQKLAIAMEALELANGVMEYCGGDAWEREVTRDDRLRFSDLHEMLLEPEKHEPEPEVPCAKCEKILKNQFELYQHMCDKHHYKHAYNRFKFEMKGNPLP